MHRIGYLTLRVRPSPGDALFVEALRELGYVVSACGRLATVAIRPEAVVRAAQRFRLLPMMQPACDALTLTIVGSSLRRHPICPAAVKLGTNTWKRQ